MRKPIKIHRGSILKTAIKNSGIPAIRAAEMAGYARGTYYLHIKNDELKLEVLDRYTTAINHDFRDEIPEMVEYYERKRANSLSTIEKAEAERDFWRDEYAKLLKFSNQQAETIESLKKELENK